MLFVDLIFIRILVDLIAGFAGLRLTMRYLNRLQEQFTNETSAQETLPGFHIRCRNECKISKIRLNFRLDEFPHEPSQLGIYLDLTIHGQFEVMAVVMPIELNFIPDYMHDGVKFEKSGEHCLVLVDSVENRQSWSSPNLYIVGKGTVERGRGKVSFTFPLAALWGSGKPHAKGGLFPTNTEDDAGQTIYEYIPEIENMEVDVKTLNKQFTADVQNTVPLPDAFSTRDMRWFTTSKGRTHTSIQAIYQQKETVDSLAFESYKDGVFLALSASLVLATGLDALWTFVNWLVKL